MAGIACSARRSFRQRHQLPRSNVAVAQQLSNSSLPGRIDLRDHSAETVQKQYGTRFREQQTLALQEEWREFLRELRCRGAQTAGCHGTNFQFRSSDSSERTADGDLLRRQITRQRLNTKDYISQVVEHISNRVCPLEQLHREIERAESRNSALLVRLQTAEERKQRLDKRAQILTDKHDALFRQEAKHLSCDKQQGLQKAVGLFQRLTHCKPSKCIETSQGIFEGAYDHVDLGTAITPWASD